jgi:hypothetical protein
MQSRWLAILQVTQGMRVFNSVQSYGQGTIDWIRIQATAIEAANIRNTQNSSQMYTFLITSITNGLIGKVILQKEQFASGTGFQHGSSLLKVRVLLSC